MLVYGLRSLVALIIRALLRTYCRFEIVGEEHLRSNRSFVLHQVLRVLLASAALIGFGLEGYAQTGQVAGQLTSTDGRINLPFFYNSKVGDACNPFVDYNCELSEATRKAAQEAAAKSGKSS